MKKMISLTVFITLVLLVLFIKSTQAQGIVKNKPEAKCQCNGNQR